MPADQQYGIAGRAWQDWPNRAAGVSGVTFHDLRGTFITERFNEGASIEHIALISGHSVKEVQSILEKHYLNPDQKLADGVILRMERTQRKRKL